MINTFLTRKKHFYRNKSESFWTRKGNHSMIDHLYIKDIGGDSVFDDEGPGRNIIICKKKTD